MRDYRLGVVDINYNIIQKPVEISKFSTSVLHQALFALTHCPDLHHNFIDPKEAVIERLQLEIFIRENNLR